MFNRNMCIDSLEPRRLLARGRVDLAGVGLGPRDLAAELADRGVEVGQLLAPVEDQLDQA